MRFKTKRDAARHIRISYSEAYAKRLAVVRSNYYDVKKRGWRPCWVIKIVKLSSGYETRR